MNKKVLIRYGTAAVGLLLLVLFTVKAISIYTHPPVAPENGGDPVATVAQQAYQQAVTVWNNQVAQKGFFALVGLFVLLVVTVPPKKRWVPKLLFSSGLVGLIIHHLLADGKIGAIWADGIQISIFWVVMAFVVKGSGMACTVWRWRVLLNGQGFKIPLKHLVESFLIGRFIGSFAPGTSGLDGYRAYDISRYTGKIARSLAVIFVEKLVGFFVLGTLLLIAVPLGHSLFVSKQVNATALVMMALVFVGMMGASFVVLFKPGIIRFVVDRFVPANSPIRPKLNKAIGAVAAYEHHRWHLAKAMFIGFGVHLCTIGMYFCTARAIMQTPDSTNLFVTAALMIGATVMPLSIAGIGMREGVFVFFLGPVAAIYAFGGYLVGELISLVGGPVWLARRSDYYEVMQVQRAAVNEGVEEDEEVVASEQKEIDEAAQTAPVRESLGSYAVTGAVSGWVAGVLVAALDAVRLWLIGGVDWSLPGYGALLYGPFLAILGLVAGVKIGVFDRLVDKGSAGRVKLGTFIGGLLFFIFSLPIGYFYLFRDLFGEKLGLFSPKMLGSVVLLAIGLGALVVLTGFVVRKVFGGREKPASHFFGAGVALGLTICFVVMWMVAGGRAAGEPLGPVPTAKRPNIVLVMNDTHRADYSGPYGNKEGLTPNLDRLAEAGVVYNGYANASWTRPSVSTILTGRYASSHTAMMKGSVLPDDITTMAEVLKAGGYETIGLVTNYNLAPFFNMDQGFVDYRYLSPNLPLFSTDEQSKLIFIEVLKKVKAKFQGTHEVPEDYYVIGEHVTDAALERLDRRKKERPFFMFVSYMDVHDPYFRHPYDGYGISHRAHPNPDPAEQSLVDEMKSLYKGEIRYWDEQFGRLMSGLKKRGLYDDTLVLVVSDHGEEFGEHGGFWHGTTLYDELLNVLFIAKYPASSPLGSVHGERVDAWHALVDVAPMIITEAGLEVPDEMQGVAVHKGERDLLFAEEDHQGNILRSVRFESKQGDAVKWIEANPNNPRGLDPKELYLIEKDPGEQQNVVDANEMLATEAVGQMAGAQQMALKGRATRQSTQLSGEMKSQLDALGYMEDEKNKK